MSQTDILKVGKYSLNSRLILGSGKYKTFELMKECFDAAETSMVTVAVRRVNLEDRSGASFWSYLPKDVLILPNTAGCYNLEDTLRTARIARELCETDLIKVEVLGDPKTLLPDTEALLQATKILVKEGFVVMPYTNDDPIMARKLVEAGAAAVMPLASPIGSGLGILNPYNIKLIREIVTTVPVIVDAGVGTASDAAITMELGVDGILMNTAVAEAENPVQMASAMKLATQAGRMAFFAKRMPKRGTRRPFQSKSWSRDQILLKKLAVISGIVFSFSSLLGASQKIFLPITAYDAGTLSAETLGRGNTSASGASSLGAAEASPAGLVGTKDSSLYTTIFAGATSSLSRVTVRNNDPISQKIMQNLAFGSEKGALYYEPLGRVDQDQQLIIQNSSASSHVDFAVDAIGFAAAEEWNKGSIGISLAYLNASYSQVIRSTTTGDSFNSDRGYGFRLNLSVRQPTGPFMWGAQLENIPGFLFWNHHRRDQIPVKARIGNTWRIQPGVLFSIDEEKRFYREGSDKNNYTYVGMETGAGSNLSLRAGLFSDDIGQPDKRHWTGGLTWKLSSGAEVSYALESFIEENQNIKQSLVSVRVPLEMESAH